jgi:hypothetical protein
MCAPYRLYIPHQPHQVGLSMKVSVLLHVVGDDRYHIIAGFVFPDRRDSHSDWMVIAVVGIVSVPFVNASHWRVV